MTRIAVLAALLLALAPAARADTLVDQTTPAGGGTSTAEDSGGVGYDGETADDFTVPAAGWHITEVDASGQNYGGAASQVVRITFYADASGLPGAQVAQQSVAMSTTNPAFTIPLPAAVDLGPGTYWLSVQVVGPTGAAQYEWFWRNRTTTSGHPAAFRQPHALTCKDWTVRSTCQAGANEADQLFALKGSDAIPPTGTATPTPTPTPAPTYAIPTATPTPTPTATATPPANSSAFKLGKPKRKGTAIRVPVTVPNAGVLKVRITAKKLKVGTKRAQLTAGKHTLKVKLSRKARRRLRHHSLKAKVKATFTGAGLTASVSHSRKLKLKR